MYHAVNSKQKDACGLTRVNTHTHEQNDSGMLPAWPVHLGLQGIAFFLFSGFSLRVFVHLSLPTECAPPAVTLRGARAHTDRVSLWEPDGAAGCTHQRESAVCRHAVHLKMVQTVNAESCAFYHNYKKR